MCISGNKWILSTFWSTRSYKCPSNLISCSQFFSLFPSILPHVLWDCNVPRGHHCLVGAGKLAEDTSFLCLYIHARLFSVVPLPHCTVHSELDRLSLTREWSRQIIAFFPTAGRSDSWLTQSSIFTLSREVNKSIGSGSYMFSSCTFRSVGLKDETESVT